MDVITDPENCSASSAGAHEVAGSDGDAAAAGHAITIGVFDGIHLGHRRVLNRVRQIAEQRSLKSALVTFDPHPARVLRPDLAPSLLTGLEHKLELLEEVGLDTVVVVPFDKTRAGESAEDFVASVLVGCLGAKAIIVGEDFHFGKDRLGNIELLTELGGYYEFDVHGQPLIGRPSTVDRMLQGSSLSFDDLGEAVSSTAIRRALGAGQVSLAAHLLGRNHEVRGEVIAGDQRGRTIGVPTANVLVPPGYAIPGDAVYAGWYLLPDGTRWPSAVNVGRRPTFYQQAEHSLVEAHLIGFDGDLYGQSARVQFVERLRGEQRFDGVESLKAQLHVDIADAGRLLTGL